MSDLRKLAEAHLSDGHVKYDTGQCEVCRSSRAILALLDRVERLEREVEEWKAVAESHCTRIEQMERKIRAALEVDRG